MSSFQGQFQLGHHVYLITDGSIVTSSITCYAIIAIKKPLLFTFLQSPMMRFSTNLLDCFGYKFSKIEMDNGKLVFTNLLAQRNVKNVFYFAV